MADPLTSSDMLSIERGGGPSAMASTEERRRFAAAGELPLNSMDMVKFAEGRGISPMAGTEDKAAWKMAEYMSGRREQAPVEYGGLGDRPQGSSRRAIRMQEAYDVRQAQMLEQERALQAMDIQRKQMEINNAQETRAAAVFQSGLDEARAQAKIDTETEIQRARFDSGFAELDPRTPEFLDQLGALRKESPLVFVVPEVKGLVDQYLGINEIYMEADKERRAEEKALQAEQDSRDETQAEIAADVVTFGVTPEEQAQMLEPNLPAGVVRFNPNASKSVIAGAKLRQEEGKEAKTDKKAADKDFTSRLRESQKALAAYNSILATEEEKIKGRLEYGIPLSDVEQEKAKKKLNTTVPELVKALAEARGAAAVLDLPMIQDKSDLSKYKSGDRVLAPDGITVMLVP